MTFQRYKKYSDSRDDGRAAISDFNRIGLTRRQQYAIEYLKEENRVLCERLGGKRLRFTDKERRRLAVKAKVLGLKKLAEYSIITIARLLDDLVYVLVQDVMEGTEDDI